LLALGTGLAYGQQSQTASLPEQVIAFAELNDVVSLDAKLMALVARIAPEVPVPPLAAVLPMGALKTADPATVDLTKPLQVVVLEPPLHTSPVLVFSVTDGQAYLDSLVDGVEKERDEGKVHVYKEGEAGLDEEDWEDDDWGEEEGWSEGLEQPLAIAVAGGRAVLGRDVEAVKGALALLEAGSFSGQPLFQGSDAGGMVRLKRLLDTLAAEGTNPFEMMRGMAAMSAGMGPTPGPDPRAILEVYVDALEAMAKQIDVAAAGVSLDETAITAWSRGRAVEGSGLAAYIAQTPSGDLELLQHLPPDAMLVFATKLGDLTPVATWYGRIFEALAPAEEGTPAGKLGEILTEAVGLLGGEIAMAAATGPEGGLLTSTAYSVEDVDGMKAFLGSVPELMVEFSDALKPLGVAFGLTYNPAAASHAGHEIGEWRYDLQFSGPEGMPNAEGVAAMQQNMVAAFWGGSMATYETFSGDVCFQTQGTGALDAVKRMIDGQAPSAADSEFLAAAMEGMPENPMAVGYLLPGKFISFYLGALVKASSAGGMPVMIPPQLANIEFESGAPIGFGAWVADDGAVEKRFRIPIETIAGITDGFRQAFMPPQEGMMP
jgi:hypothetical protein